jgi:hypothetical protein
MADNLLSGIPGTPNLQGNVSPQGVSYSFQPARVTTTQRDAMTGVAGLLVYNTTTGKLNVYTTAWEAVTSV